MTERALIDRETNLRIGFRFLNDLLGKFDHDMHLALLAYNRGPARVEEILAQGGESRPTAIPTPCCKGIRRLANSVVSPES